jgi:hypothetical protein
MLLGMLLGVLLVMLIVAIPASVVVPSVVVKKPSAGDIAKRSVCRSPTLMAISPIPDSNPRFPCGVYGTDRTHPRRSVLAGTIQALRTEQRCFRTIEGSYRGRSNC